MSLRELHETYGEEVEFLSIYIREAHPVDGWWFGRGLPRVFFGLTVPKAATDVYDPTLYEERREVAERCSQALDYGFPTYVDTLDDYVNRAYAAWPTRLYLIGVDGRVAYAGGVGPWGFKSGELQIAIEDVLSPQPEAVT